MARNHAQGGGAKSAAADDPFLAELEQGIQEAAEFRAYVLDVVVIEAEHSLRRAREALEMYKNFRAAGGTPPTERERAP